MASLYALGKQLSALYGQVFLCNAAASKLMEICGADVVVYLINEAGIVEPVTDRKEVYLSARCQSGRGPVGCRASPVGWLWYRYIACCACCVSATD